MTATACRVTRESGVATLDAPELGTLDLTQPGLVFAQLEVGHPVAREVARTRALADGVIDDTRFLGSRSVTLLVRFDVNVFAEQALYDVLRPYLSPRYRPTLTWSHRGSAGDLRSLTVRGVDAPFTLAPDQQLFPTMGMQFVSTTSAIQSPTENLATFSLTGTVELGRDYVSDDQFGPHYQNAGGNFNRQYRAQSPIGSQFVANVGNVPADWTATIFANSGTVVDPVITINGTDMAFTENGGLTIPANQTLVINTAERTILLNDDPTTSAYDRVNFLDWAWDDLRIPPGTDNVVSLNYDVASTSVDAVMSFRWRDSWL